MTTRNKRIRTIRGGTGPATPLQVDHMNLEILAYVPEGGYLFYAPVCTAWSSAWKDASRDTVTDVDTEDASLSQIKECIDLGIEVVTVSMMKKVARSGDLCLLGVMCSRREEVVNDGRVLTAAVSSGNFEMVRWLFHSQGCSTAWDPLDPAAMRGDIEMYNWLRENGATRTWRTASKAAIMGHLDMLKVIHADDCNDGYGKGLCQSEYDEAMSSAIYKKQVHVMDWLLDVGVGS